MKKLSLFCLLIIAEIFCGKITKAQNSWSITGNSGTSPSTNFVGTTDNKGLSIKTNNNEAIRIDNKQNVGIGTTSPVAKLDIQPKTSAAFEIEPFGTSAGNTGELRMSELVSNGSQYVGFKAPDRILTSVIWVLPDSAGNPGQVLSTDGNGNLSWGKRANATLSNLKSPTAVNKDLLPDTNNNINFGSATSGWKDIYFTGTFYLGGNKFISPSNYWQSTFVGFQAGNVSDNFDNTAVGYQALYSNTTGESNTAIGTEALPLNSIGSENTASGSYTLEYNNSGSDNNADGFFALRYNTDGGGNTATGAYALFANTTASDNTANGFLALSSNTTGSGNTADGTNALFSTTGGGNTAVGNNAGENVNTGTYNTFIGANTNCGSSGGLTNSTVIGAYAMVLGSNNVVIGNESVTSIGGYVNWSNLSDKRVKRNIHQNVPGLTFINLLQPITYNLDLDAADKIMQRPIPKDKDGNIIDLTDQEQAAKREKEQIVYSGFVAQDVEAAANKVNYNFSGVDKPQNEHQLYGLRYADFIVPLVKAVQELSQQNDNKDAKIADLQKQVDELKELVLNNLKSNNDGSIKSFSDSLNSTMLGQNIPNPFSKATIIPFRISKDCHSAYILIVNSSSSQVLHVIPINSKEDHVNLDGNLLINGSYSYSLYIDGRLIDTKQMILAQ